MQVTTMRSKSSLKPLIPCSDDSVNKLEGLGEKTRRNLLDVRACAASLELAAAVPQECRNTVTTGWSPPLPPPPRPPPLRAHRISAGPTLNESVVSMHELLVIHA